MRVTAEYLRSLGACEVEVELFAKLWPKGVSINKRSALRALREGMDVPWLVSRVCAADTWTAYKEAEAHALTAYKEAEANAFEAYQEAVATAACAALREVLP